MRADPLGAWHAADLDAVAEQAARQGAVSHRHPEAVAAAVAVALAAALATRSRGGPTPARPNSVGPAPPAPVPPEGAAGPERPVGAAAGVGNCPGRRTASPASAVQAGPVAVRPLLSVAAGTLDG
ncbi:ADP-ribosylglycohydrolase family protein [Streptomyces sp. NPDC002671]